MPDGGRATGQAASRSPPPCSITTGRQARPQSRIRGAPPVQPEAREAIPGPGGVAKIASVRKYRPRIVKYADGGRDAAAAPERNRHGRKAYGTGGNCRSARTGGGWAWECGSADRRCRDRQDTLIGGGGSRSRAARSPVAARARQRDRGSAAVSVVSGSADAVHSDCAGRRAATATGTGRRARRIVSRAGKAPPHISRQSAAASGSAAAPVRFDGAVPERDCGRATPGAAVR
jgi:hypothetical protein